MHDIEMKNKEKRKPSSSGETVRASLWRHSRRKKWNYGR